jgi:arylsulfatase A-like enzyme
MSRSTTVLTVVAAALVAVIVGTAATGPASDAAPGPSGSKTGASGETSPTAGMGPEQRLRYDARRDSVTLEPVTGGPGTAGLARPNVLVLMTDDMRDDDLQYMPNVQRLIGDQGVRFTNMFSPQPLCCPARASFDTGLYSHNHGVWSHVEPFGFRVLDDRLTVPVWMHALGYDTLFLGKYLNGYGVQPTRTGQPSTRYVPPGWTDWRGSVDGAPENDDPDSPTNYLSGGTYRYFDTTLNVNGELQPHQGAYQTRLYSRQTQEMLRAQARTPDPFFAWISFTAPHFGSPEEPDDPPPYTLPDGTVENIHTPARPDDVEGRFDDRITSIPGGADPRDDIADKPWFIRSRPPMTGEDDAAVLNLYRQRVEALSVVDDEVANIMATLERTGQLDNTYVVFTSDNGYFLGEHRMRQGKILPYEPSLRVPLMMRGPGIPAGEQRTDPFLMTDFAPTFVDAAGGEAPATVDGQSMLGVAEHGDRGWDRGILTETGPRKVSGDAEESDNFLVQSDGKTYVLRYSVGLRTGRYLYVEHADGERELYDLRTDPQQFRNVVDEPGRAGLVRALARELDRLRDCSGASCRTPMPARLRTDHPVPPYRP